MKKIILLAVAVIFIFTTSFAQEKKSEGFKGAWWGLAAGSYSDTDDQDAVYTILPAVGVFVSADITIGGAIGYTNAIAPDLDGLTGTFIVKPLARKYWGASDKFFIFLEANAPLLFNDNFSGYGFNIEPGIDYFIGGKWTVEAKFGRVGYNSIKPDGGDAVGTFNVGFNMFDSQTQEGLGSGLSLGLKYLF